MNTQSRPKIGVLLFSNNGLRKSGAGTPDGTYEERMKLPEAQVYTYTHRILVGATSITEPDGMTTYFEYDTFGRVIRSYILENGVPKTLSTNEYNTPKF